MKYIGVILATIVVMVDQITKVSALRFIGEKKIDIFSFFSIDVVYNKGISFGVLNQIKHGNIIFAVIASLLIIYLIYWYYSAELKHEVYALGIIIGGAISNVIDRFLYGGVVDFISFHFKDLFFPSFNVADSAIFLGVCILIVFGINWKKQPNINQDKL